MVPKLGLFAGGVALDVEPLVRVGLREDHRLEDQPDRPAEGVVDPEPHGRYDESPPRVEYELTRLGLTLREPLAAIRNWAEAHLPEIMAARERVDGHADGHPLADG